MLKVAVVLAALVLVGCNDKTRQPTSPNQIAAGAGAQSMPLTGSEAETFPAGRCTLQLKESLRGGITGGAVVGTLTTPDGRTVGEITAVQLNQYLHSADSDNGRLPEVCR